MNLVVMALGRDSRDRHDDVCTPEEFQQALEGFEGNVRYQAANLAAHHWDVIRIDDTILISGAYSGGTLYNMDGTSRELKTSEVDLYYPRVEAEDYRTPSTTIYNNGKPFKRQKMIRLGHLGVEGRRADAVEDIMTQYRSDTENMNIKRVNGEYWDDERQVTNYHRRCARFRAHITATISALF